VSTYRRGSVWWFRFKFQGQLIRESSHSTSLTIAREAERARRRQLEMGINQLRKRDPMPLLRIAAERWILEKAGRAEKTISGYKERTKPIVAAFGDRLVCDITREDVLCYRARRLSEKFSPRTINYEISCLRGILDAHGLWGNVSRKLTRLRENHDVGKAVSYEHEVTLRAACGNSLAPALLPLFSMAIDTGLRAAELQSLRRKDLVLQFSQDGATILSGEVIVPKSKTEAGKGRSVPLTRRVCLILCDWLARFPDANENSYVFPRHSVQMLKGGKVTELREIRLTEPMRSWQRSWRKVLKDTSLKYRWHDLRHTFVTRLAENPDVSEETIRALAGHVSKEMLARYSHIRVKTKRAAIAALEKEQIQNSAVGGTNMGTISGAERQSSSEVIEKIWLPPRDSNPDNLLQRQVS
jgi:integrase